jgi:hypothetical protein
MKASRSGQLIGVPLSRAQIDRLRAKGAQPGIGMLASSQPAHAPFPRLTVHNTPNELFVEFEELSGRWMNRNTFCTETERAIKGSAAQKQLSAVERQELSAVVERFVTYDIGRKAFYDALSRVAGHSMRLIVRVLRYTVRPGKAVEPPVRPSVPDTAPAVPRTAPRRTAVRRPKKPRRRKYTREHFATDLSNKYWMLIDRNEGKTPEVLDVLIELEISISKETFYRYLHLWDISYPPPKPAPLVSEN